MPIFGQSVTWLQENHASLKQMVVWRDTIAPFRLLLVLGCRPRKQQVATAKDPARIIPVNVAREERNVPRSASVVQSVHARTNEGIVNDH